MIEAAVGLGVAVLAAAVGYGELRQRITDERERREEAFDLLRHDIKRIDEKVENLIDYLLRKNGDKK